MQNFLKQEQVFNPPAGVAPRDPGTAGHIEPGSGIGIDSKPLSGVVKADI